MSSSVFFHPIRTKLPTRALPGSAAVCASLQRDGLGCPMAMELNLVLKARHFRTAQHTWSFWDRGSAPPHAACSGQTFPGSFKHLQRGFVPVEDILRRTSSLCSSW